MTPAERIAYMNYSNQCIESANQLYIADSLRNQEMTVRLLLALPGCQRAIGSSSWDAGDIG
jgi:hypothetical protein